MDEPKNDFEEMSPEEAAMMGEELQSEAYNVLDQQLDLTHHEKRRTTALMMAINYYLNSVIKDAAMYDALRRDGRKLATMNVAACVEVAVQFECFITTGRALELGHDPNLERGSGENEENSGRTA